MNVDVINENINISHSGLFDITVPKNGLYILHISCFFKEYSYIIGMYINDILEYTFDTDDKFLSVYQVFNLKENDKLKYLIYR